ncbi:hypothetical protein L6452_14667 [Arctium lappa]|uniref:Uncharacterized protein n=1 Tax=Arctium lappa TaxID=4217 RepID=A0ACB9CM50_ARCLA|nr:hypothetical protein L6452_14667 [Arctium lappa]
MEQTKSLPIFFLIFMAMAISVVPTSSSTTKTYTNFVKTSCNSTTYPSICLTYLLPYATAVKSNPQRLVKQALSATLKSATTTRSTVVKLAKAKNITKEDAAVLKDCVEEIQDSIDEIKNSLKAISSLKSSANKQLLISNAQTWTSAAITDDYTCIDDFSDQNVSPAIKSKIRNSFVRIARLSSNALYLINHLNI